MTEERNDDQREELPNVTGDGPRTTAANIGRDGDALVQNDVVYGTGTDRAGTPEDREREMEERKVP
jgi:hypothetical protein